MRPRTYFCIVERRAREAGLGHVAPHDLRRTAAAILHRTKTDDGGHLFDLLDIQQVLDHADPATTQRSYLDQIDTETAREQLFRTARGVERARSVRRRSTS